MFVYLNFFSQLFFPRATPGPSTSNIYFSDYFWNRTRKVIFRYPQLKIINFVRETYECLMHSWLIKALRVPSWIRPFLNRRSLEITTCSPFKHSILKNGERFPQIKMPLDILTVRQRLDILIYYLTGSG